MKQLSNVLLISILFISTSLNAMLRKTRTEFFRRTTPQIAAKTNPLLQSNAMHHPLVPIQAIGEQLPKYVKPQFNLFKFHIPSTTTSLQFMNQIRMQSRQITENYIHQLLLKYAKNKNMMHQSIETIEEYFIKEHFNGNISAFMEWKHEQLRHVYGKGITLFLEHFPYAPEVATLGLTDEEKEVYHTIKDRYLSKVKLLNIADTSYIPRTKLQELKARFDAQKIVKSKEETTAPKLKVSNQDQKSLLPDPKPLPSEPSIDDVLHSLSTTPKELYHHPLITAEEFHAMSARYKRHPAQSMTTEDTLKVEH